MVAGRLATGRRLAPHRRTYLQGASTSISRAQCHAIEWRPRAAAAAGPREGWRRLLGQAGLAAWGSLGSPPLGLTTPEPGVPQLALSMHPSCCRCAAACALLWRSAGWCWAHCCCSAVLEPAGVAHHHLRWQWSSPCPGGGGGLGLGLQARARAGGGAGVLDIGAVVSSGPCCSRRLGSSSPTRLVGLELAAAVPRPRPGPSRCR